MKKILFTILLLFPVYASAQSGMGTIKLGLFDPSATGSGFIIGYEGGWHIDNNFSLGWSVDWFHKSYVDENLVNEFNNTYGLNSTLNELRAKTNVHAIPIMGNATVSWSVARRTMAYVTGGAGIEVLLIYYRNYDNPNNDEFKGAYDFAWKLGGGVAYEIGARSDALLEIGYTNSQPGWSYQVKDSNTGITRVFERKFDMSGILLRVGFRFYF